MLKINGPKFLSLTSTQIYLGRGDIGIKGAVPLVGLKTFFQDYKNDNGFTLEHPGEIILIYYSTEWLSVVQILPVSNIHIKQFFITKS